MTISLQIRNIRKIFAAFWATGCLSRAVKHESIVSQTSNAFARDRAAPRSKNSTAVLLMESGEPAQAEKSKPPHDELVPLTMSGIEIGCEPPLLTQLPLAHSVLAKPEKLVPNEHR
ncbi:MAG TPA: hypothetical protein VE135_09550 [Pyrinomonadaceae bacterium]|nr:hypothetical protein [Pyrinomonadaceae bacterium]